jgi:hypothetical protein
MKKVFAIFLALIIGLSMSAQIQRTFLGFALGTTTKSEVYNKYKDEKYFLEYDNGDYAVGALEFAGQKWDVTTFAFYNNRLLSVHFALLEYSTPLSILDSKWDDLKARILNKYGDYNYYFDSEYLLFTDNKTRISLSYLYATDTKALGLMYTDEALKEQQRKEEDSDL